MNFDPKTFCAAPWFQIRNEQFGEYKPCAVIDITKTQFRGCTRYKWPDETPEQYLNSDYSAYLRKELTNGNQLPECHHCWYHEKIGQLSPRESINNIVASDNEINNSWVKLYLKHKKDYTHDYLISADVKLTNVCNFACVMCSPVDSSQIYTSWSKTSNPFIKNILLDQPKLLENIKKNYIDRNNHDLLKLLISKSPKFLKLLGGEPLLDQTSIKILQSVELEDRKKIELLFVTNGSIDLCSTAESLSGYRGINFVISLDGIGSVQDYIRKGSNWHQIEQNIKRWADKYPINRLNIHATVQALNILHIQELQEWTNNQGLKLDLGILEKPSYLSLAAVPQTLRDQVPDYLKNLFVNAPLDPVMTNQLKEYINWYDPDQKWRTILPEWISVL